MTADLVAFLRQRLDTDACNAAHIHAVRCASHGYNPGEDGPHYAPWRCDCGVPARVLADVQAKRRIIAYLAETAAQCPEDDWPANGGMEWAPMADDARYLLRLHAQPYADHPGFDPAWRVSTAVVGEHQT